MTETIKLELRREDVQMLLRAASHYTAYAYGTVAGATSLHRAREIVAKAEQAAAVRNLLFAALKEGGKEDAES